MKAIIEQRWQAMPERDRKVYCLLAIFLVLVLLYAFVWQPSVQARANLRHELLEKKSQLAQMQLQAKQIQTLKSAVRLSQSSPSGLKTALEASAKLHHMDAQISKIDALADGGLHLSLRSVSFDQWVSWAYALQSEHQIRIASAHIKALPAGMVHVEVDLVATQ
jgi:type II secretory pathway component PulM